MSFPRYPKYKESGVEWLGEVPEGWEVKRLACLGNFSKGTGGTKADESDSGAPCVRYGLLYSAYSTKIETPVSFIPETKRSDYTAVQSGDVLFAASGETLDEIGKSAVVLLDDCVCGGDVVIFRPEKRQEHSSDFLGYLCDSPGVQAQKSAKGRGLTVMHIYPTQLRDLRVPIPPPPEQTAIAAFLDRETAKIDGLVAEQRRLMELLKEKRQAVISHAVTKGLNPAAPMKDSGIEWLGEVPEHWRCTKLSHPTTRIGDGLHGTPKYVDESNHRFINGNNLAGGEIVFTETTRCVSEDEAQIHRVELNGSTLLLSINGTIGNLAFYRGETVMLGKSAAYINCREELNRDFLFWFLRSSHIARYFDYSVTETTINNLSLESVRGLPVALPPLEEQSEIVTNLNDRAGRFDTLTAEAQRAIALLQERRTALISAAVTGQIDVRSLSFTP